MHALSLPAANRNRHSYASISTLLDTPAAGKKREKQSLAVDDCRDGRHAGERNATAPLETTAHSARLYAIYIYTRHLCICRARVYKLLARKSPAVVRPAGQCCPSGDYEAMCIAAV